MNPDFTRYQTLPRFEAQISDLPGSRSTASQPSESSDGFALLEIPLPFAAALSRGKRDDLSPAGAPAKAVSSLSGLFANPTEVGDKTNPPGIIGKYRLLLPLPERECRAEGKTAVPQSDGAQPLKSPHSYEPRVSQ